MPRISWARRSAAPTPMVPAMTSHATRAADPGSQPLGRRYTPRMAADVLTVVVEIPKGSRNKYELDHDSGAIYLDRMLFTSMQYPADYGFIDGTLGGDGDPLDALVFVGEPTFPGCRIRVRPIGMFRMTDEKGEDEKVLCVPLRDPMWSHVEGLDGIPQPLLDEIEHFFQVYKDLEGHAVETDGFEDLAAAERVIAEAFARAGTSR
jgi:inorganic pyrophosphatase